MICFDQGLQVFPKKGELGGEAATLEKGKKSQQFVHDCILDPFWDQISQLVPKPRKFSDDVHVM